MVEAAGVEPASEDLHPLLLHACPLPIFSLPSVRNRQGPDESYPLNLADYPRSGNAASLL